MALRYWFFEELGSDNVKLTSQLKTCVFHMITCSSCSSSYYYKDKNKSNQASKSFRYYELRVDELRYFELKFCIFFKVVTNRLQYIRGVYENGPVARTHARTHTRTHTPLLHTYGKKVETWKFKASESADRVQTIICWPVVIDSSIRVSKLADKSLYLTKGLMQQIKTKIFILDVSNFLSVHHSQKVNCTIYILYL